MLGMSKNCWEKSGYPTQDMRLLDRPIGPKLICLQRKGKRVRKNKRNKRIKRYSIKTGLELW